MNWMSEAELLEALRAGVTRSSDMIARITDYHGGPITTEYILTSDIARELIERNYQVEVEYLNRHMVNAVTARRSGARLPKLGSKRTDVAVLENEIVPLAIIEVKIGIKTIRGIAKDVQKITDTIGALKPQYAAHVWGASVFQVHVVGGPRRYQESHFRKAIEDVEKKLEFGLRAKQQNAAGFQFTFHPFQRNNEGIVPRELEPDGEGLAWGQHGHATRYYAVLIRSTQQAPQPPRTFAELKAQSLS